MTAHSWANEYTMNHDEFKSDGLSRLSFMLRAGYGLGALSLGQLMGNLDASAAPQNIPEVNAGLLNETHLEPRAKRIIFIHTLGAMSQADYFRLQADAGPDARSAAAALGKGHGPPVDDGCRTDVVSRGRTPSFRSTSTVRAAPG